MASEAETVPTGAEPRFVAHQVGEFVTLTAISDVPIVSVQWTFEGLPISDALQTVDQGLYIPLGFNNVNPIRRAWLEPGSWFVTCTGLTTEGPAFAEHAIEIFAPRVTKFESAITGTAQVVTKSDGKTYLQLLQPDGRDGIWFDAEVDSNGAFGWLGFLQLASEERARYVPWPQGEVSSLNDRWVLDVGANPNSILYRGEEFDLVSGGSTKLAASDGPGAELASPIDQYFIGSPHLDADEQYRMFIVFMPRILGSVWVPLWEVKWGWSGAAQEVDGAYSLRNPAERVQWASFAGLITEFDQMPAWTSNTDSRQWINT